MTHHNFNNFGLYTYNYHICIYIYILNNRNGGNRTEHPNCKLFDDPKAAGLVSAMCFCFTLCSTSAPGNLGMD